MSDKLDKKQFIERLTSQRYRSLDTNQKMFVDQWISAHYVDLIVKFRGYCAVVAVIDALGSIPFTPLRTSLTIAVGNLATVVCLYLWRFSSLTSDQSGRWFWYGIVGSSAVPTSLAISMVFSVPEFGPAHFWVTMGYTCTFFFMITACPYFGMTSVVTAIIGFIAGFIAYSSTGMFNQWVLMGAIGSIAITGCILNWMAFAFAVSEAYAQLVRRDLLRQNEVLKKESLEKDLYLAREVQDSFLPPEGGLKLPQNYVARFYKTNSHTLGGDWMAYRVLEDKTLVAMILDATGKGTAAALVVHAVQSLWVKSLSYPQFDIEEWIQSINRTLCNLGQRTVHSVTMGMVAFRPGQNLTYYSCGHVPIFATCDGHGEDSKVISLTAGGDILGLKKDCHIGQITMNDDVSTLRSIFLGTDGIFPRGTRTKLRSIATLEHQLEHADESYLNTVESKDDKLLLWIHREAS
jgi:hypothetical protein